MGPARVPTVAHFREALLGLAVGDALGRPVEGQRRDEIRRRPREEWSRFRGYSERRFARPFPPGSWSDDTQQALLLADSLVACRGLDDADYAARLYALWRSGAARGYGRVYQKAMERRDAGLGWDEVAVEDDLMNGAAMRIVPLGLFYWWDAAALTEAAARSSRVTHGHPAAVAGAAGVAHAVSYALTQPEAPHDVTRFVAHLQTQVATLHAETAAQLGVLSRAAALEPDDAFDVLSEVPEFAMPAVALVVSLIWRRGMARYQGVGH